MNIWDCHLHSDLSFDSSEPMENYVKIAAANGDECFITTEHMDLESHFANGDDIAADFDRQQQIIRELNEKYPVEILFGIEIGWRKDIHSRNLQIAEKYPFDMIILSLHESDYCDVAFPEFRQGKTIDQCYNEYLCLVENAIRSFDNFDTFAHIDYVLRYIGHTDLEKHREKLSDIFRLLIEKGKALEINTKVIQQPESVERMEYIIKLYASLGGRKVTVGSDGHSVQRYKNGFSLVFDTLKKYGINQVCLYRKRREICVYI